MCLCCSLNNTGQHWSLHGEVRAVTCALWMCSWMFQWEAKQLRDSPCPKGHRLEPAFFVCFLDFAIIMFLTLLCTPHVYSLRSILGGGLQCSPSLQVDMALLHAAPQSCCRFSAWGLAAAHCIAALGCHCLLAQPLELLVQCFGHSLILLTSLVLFALSFPAFLDCEW